MSKRVTDLNAEELELLASEAWRAAAFEALAKGFSVTGSEDGRRYRYHPDGRKEDLGPVSIEPTDATSRSKKSRKSKPVRDTNEKMKAAAEEAIEAWEKTKAALEEAIEVARLDPSTTTGQDELMTRLLPVETSIVARARHDFEVLSVKIRELAALAQQVAPDDLTTVKSLSEVVELSMSDMRKHFEALEVQNKVFASFMQKVITEKSKAIVPERKSSRQPAP